MVEKSDEEKAKSVEAELDKIRKEIEAEEKIERERLKNFESFLRPKDAEGSKAEPPSSPIPSQAQVVAPAAAVTQPTQDTEQSERELEELILGTSSSPNKPAQAPSAPPLEGSSNPKEEHEWLERQYKAGLQPTEQAKAEQPPLEAEIEPPSNRGIKSIMYTNYVFPEIDAKSMKGMTTEDIFQKTVRGSEFKLITAEDSGNYINDDGDLKFTCIRDEEGYLSFNYTKIKNGSIIIPNQTNDGKTCDIVVMQDGKVVKFLDGRGGLDKETTERFKKEAQENAHLYADAVKQEAAAAQAVSVVPQQTGVERVAEVFTSAKDVLMEAVRSVINKVGGGIRLPEHHAALKDEMEKKVAQGELEKAVPRISKEALPANAVRVTEYGEGDASLKKTELNDGTYTFEAGREFTGVIKMPRKGDDGKLLDSFDWVQFVDGKVVENGVIEGLGGKSIIANLGKLKQKAGITVAPPEAHKASATIHLPEQITPTSPLEVQGPSPTPQATRVTVSRQR